MLRHFGYYWPAYSGYALGALLFIPAFPLVNLLGAYVLFCAVMLTVLLYSLK